MGTGIAKISRVRVRWHGERVIEAVNRAEIKTMRGAGLIVMRAAKRSLKSHSKTKVLKTVGDRTFKTKQSSPEGSPPNTSGILRKAIAFQTLPIENAVIIGPRAEVAGQVGRAHEFGGRYRGRRYKKRPFMGPALDKVRKDLPRLWEGTVKS